jgi:CRP-like cAMP-binding protein
MRLNREVSMRKNAKVELLSRVPLFSACSKRQLGEIAAIADEIATAPGTDLIVEGTRGREFLVVTDGTVRVTRGGRKLAELGPGSFVGEMALLSDEPRSATVTATTAVRLLVITDRGFRRLLEENPPIAMRVLEAVAARVAATESTP